MWKNKFRQVIAATAIGALATITPVGAQVEDVSMGARGRISEDGQLVVQWFTRGFDHYNVRWAVDGGPAQQRERAGDKDFLFIGPYHSGRTYRISVQGCDKPTFGRSTCTSWDSIVCGRAYNPCSGEPEGLRDLSRTNPPRPPREAIDRGMENNTDRPGSDFIRSRLPRPDPGICRQACMNDRSHCRSWTYVRPGVQDQHAVCYLKNAAPRPVPNICCVSGVLPGASPSRFREQSATSSLARPGPGGMVRESSSGLSAVRCSSGFVWREARVGDSVCVTPESRARVRAENTTAASRVDRNGAYGRNTCLSGFVWREAFDGDVVCVAPEIRDLVRRENALAASRRAQ